jgi:hypothetical protein
VTFISHHNILLKLVKITNAVLQLFQLMITTVLVYGPIQFFTPSLHLITHQVMSFILIASIILIVIELISESPDCCLLLLLLPNEILQKHLPLLIVNSPLVINLRYHSSHDFVKRFFDSLGVLCVKFLLFKILE